MKGKVKNGEMTSGIREKTDTKLYLCISANLIIRINISLIFHINVKYSRVSGEIFVCQKSFRVLDYRGY